MKLAKNLGKLEREKIFELFFKNNYLKFSQIEKELGIRSNQLVYHLNSMISEGLIEKEGDLYKLTLEAEKVLPFFKHITGQEIGALPVVLVAVLKDDNICFLKRKKRPYNGYWGMIGGKVRMQESISENALREVKEETGLDCEFSKINKIVYERVNEDGKFKHAFVLFFVSVKAISDKIVECDEGEVKWFDLKELDNLEIIPSDLWMIKNYLDSKSDMKQVIINEKSGKLLGIDVL